ncbi:uncharacterized protein LOC121733423 isoform X2 [Aricia agestis]|uniref:uncharacterized protein LOC121733423 isoform X2 n=1 Tax=Aricia agestis TaxID=91739 RepID=UPI001C203638|nr:uncharacterized protein LOC121733423 isoform X2 [Aricia agestis]
MGLTSNTGLLASVQAKHSERLVKEPIQLCCEVSPAPFILRPYAGLYNPFSHNCSVLCNHPADTTAKEYVRRAKDAWVDGKAHHFHEDLSKFEDCEKEKTRTPHDIVTEDMFRRYTETDSRPLTPAPTLASGKSRGSRRCLTPDQPLQRTAIVLDLRRSHSQETLYYRGYSVSDVTHHTSSPTNERSLPSLHLSDNRLKQCEQLPPLASPLVLSRRSTREPVSVRSDKKNQLKALNIGKEKKPKKTEAPASQRSRSDKDANGSEPIDNPDDSGEVRRRGKRRRKVRGGSDRLTSAGLAAQAQQDPETQVAGIDTDSRNHSSRGSIAPPPDTPLLPLIKSAPRKTDSFLDDEILKYLHREVDEEAIETEFDTKRRYVLQEALRTRPQRARTRDLLRAGGLGGLAEGLGILGEQGVSGLGEWLHVPRVFSRRNARFTLPIDTNALADITPMQFAARYVSIQKSKRLLYLTVLRRFRDGYRMPIADIPEGLVLMMGGILTQDHVREFEDIMRWGEYVEGSDPDDIKLTLDTDGLDGDKIEMELSDFSMIETKLVMLTVPPGLEKILRTISNR